MRTLIFFITFFIGISNAHSVIVIEEKLIEDSVSQFAMTFTDQHPKTQNKKTASLDASITATIDYLKTRISGFEDDKFSDLETLINSYTAGVLNVYEKSVSTLTVPTDDEKINAQFNSLIHNTQSVLKTTITQWLTSSQESVQQKQLSAISKKIDDLNNAQTPKMLRPVKDVEFLYEAVLAGEIFSPYEKESNQFLINEMKRIDPEFEYLAQVRMDENLFTSDILEIKYKKIGSDTLVGKKLPEPEQSLDLKLAIVENFLNLKPSEGDLLKDRIEAAYKAINNHSWETDNLRFGVLVSEIKDADTVATSAAIHSYFAYRRFMPGRLDFIRRMSFLFGLGFANETSGDAGIEGPIYTLGLGFDVDTGVVLNVGYSIYSYRQNSNANFERDESISIGITLNSDLWKSLQ